MTWTKKDERKYRLDMLKYNKSTMEEPINYYQLDNILDKDDIWNTANLKTMEFAKGILLGEYIKIYKKISCLNRMIDTDSKLKLIDEKTTKISTKRLEKIMTNKKPLYFDRKSSNYIKYNFESICGYLSSCNEEEKEKFKQIILRKIWQKII